MRSIVIIPTAGRKAILKQTLMHLERQTRLPDEIIVSAPDDSHVEMWHSDVIKISYLFGKRGLTLQRNQAIEAALENADLITFFDDDFIPADNYLAIVQLGFEQNLNWAVITGRVVKDGIGGAGLTFAEGLQALKTARPASDVRNVANGYGCNMSFRARDIGSLRFDERLVLYGWQEDVDFTYQFKKYGLIVNLGSLLGVHLGAKTGRLSGVRFGYSQIVNPIYLIRKGTVPVGASAVLIFRNVLANIVRSLRPEPWIDRRGRLYGNLLGAAHILVRRIEPEFILKL